MIDQDIILALGALRERPVCIVGPISLMSDEFLRAVRSIGPIEVLDAGSERLLLIVGAPEIPSTDALALETCGLLPDPFSLLDACFGPFPPWRAPRWTAPAIHLPLSCISCSTLACAGEPIIEYERMHIRPP